MSGRYLFYLVLGILIVVITSCSGGGGNPFAPGNDEQLRDYRSPLINTDLQPEDWKGHDPWLFCTFVFNTSKNTIEVIENHTAQAHFNVRPLLTDPFVCPNLNCITVALVSYDPVTKIFTVEVTLRNPTMLTGFDVRGIMYLKPSKPIALMNPDDYIVLYDSLEQVNPFRAFAKSAPNRQFLSSSVYNEIYEVYIPPPPPLFNINYAIDVSWPGNCKEPYEIIDQEYSGTLTPEGGSGTIRCRVNDHQDDIESVQVDLHDITGGYEDMIYDPIAGMWSVTFSNTEGAEIGEYTCLIAAKSVDYNLKLYDYIDVEVIEGGDQYITGRIFDCYTMDDLDGAEVSVFNQDIFGYQPPPEYVAGGMYSVAVDPGIYDMAISTVGYDIMVCNGVIVPGGETYEADFGLNLMGDPNPNPYPYTGGVVGKVTDAGTGDPIPDASVRVRSDDLDQLGMSPQPKFSSGAACIESGYYSVTEIMCSSDTYEYTPAYQWTVYCSAPGYEAVELSSGVMIEPNITIPNVHFELNPIEIGKTIIYEENFELSTGWTYEPYVSGSGMNLWHVQQWNAGIVNICATNGWVSIAPDEDDGAIIPEPPLSDYNPGPNTRYMWYGGEDEGSFLGLYDLADQSPGGGGNSMMGMDHGGYAVSPEIDLSGYSNGLLAFQSFWEIESMNSSSYDYCEVFIRDDTGFDTALDFLNPAVDPIQSGDPVSSGGHNRDGVWHHLVYDITPYMSNTSAHVVFRFYTYDELYNGFKGWFIDNVYIYGY